MANNDPVGRISDPGAWILVDPDLPLMNSSFHITVDEIDSVIA